LNGAKKHQLQPGTLLDDRYLIEKVLGEGGFGITYAGVNQRINVKVAIKEFYWRDYVTRDIDNSPEISIISEDNQDMIANAKEKFMKEARVIGDFIDESSIVDVTDYFEANNTAYIVMNYLDGVTLKGYLRNKEPLAAETIFRKMIPIMEGLIKVHSCGIIHRDISPDNIMMAPDGNLKLLDFGAARDYSALRDKSYSVIVKGGYAPVEQYNSNSIQGPWTDIYALCATLYECITGQLPDDALQRVFHDELKKPSELNIKMDKDLEKILWKGLSVSPEDRYQSMDEMIEDIQKILKDEVPEQKKSKWKLPVIIACICATLIIALTSAYIYADNHIASFKFRGIQTETVVLIPDENMSAKEYQTAKEIISDRLNILAGEDNYLIQEDKDSNLTIITPLDIYHNKDVATIIKSFISRPARLFVSPIDGSPIEITPEDFVDIEKYFGKADGIIPSEWNLPENEDYTYYELKLSDEKTEVLLNLMDNSNKINFYQDIDKYSPVLSLTCYYQASSKTFAFVEENDSFVTALKYNLSHDKFSLAFSVMGEIAAQWENASQSLMAGANQVNEDAIADPAVYLKYTTYLSDISKGQWYNVIADIKTRMDALEIPYAFGIANDNEHSFTIKIAKEQASFETSYILGTNIINLMDVWKNSTYPFLDGLSIESLTDGTYSLKVKISEYSTERLTEATQATLNGSSHDLYLNIGGCNLFKLSLSEPLTEDSILFTQFNRSENSQITTENLPFLNYIDSIITFTNLPTSYSLNSSYATTENGQIDLEYNLQNQSLFGLNQENNVTKEVKRLFPDCTVTEYYESDFKSLDVTFHQDLNTDFIKNTLNAIQEFYNTCSSDLEQYYAIRFYWSENTNQNLFTARIIKSLINQHMILTGTLRGTMMEPHYTELQNYLSNSDFYKSLGDYGWEIGNTDFEFTTETEEEAVTQ